jgi:hypothetical protein
VVHVPISTDMMHQEQRGLSPVGGVGGISPRAAVHMLGGKIRVSFFLLFRRVKKKVEYLKGRDLLINDLF